jgi:hypothetical protein
VRRKMPDNVDHRCERCTYCQSADGYKPASEPITSCPDCWYRWWWWQAQTGSYRIQQLLVDYGHILQAEAVSRLESTENGPPRKWVSRHMPPSPNAPPF